MSSEKQLPFAMGSEVDSAEPNATMVAAAVKLAKDSDVVILVLGDTPDEVGEWKDRSSLDLKFSQLNLLNSVASAIDATKTALVVVLVHGNQLTFGAQNSVLNHVDALLSAGRPGQLGGLGIADLLVGTVSPSGRLAANWPRATYQVGTGASPFLARVVGKWVANGQLQSQTASIPHDADGRYYDSFVDAAKIDGVPVPTPLFRFGWGLTYTTFAYSGASIAVVKPAAGTGSAEAAPATFTVTLANTGSVKATDVVQVYCTDPSGGISNVVRHWKRLIAFQRVTLAPGANVKVTLPLLASELGSHDDKMVFRITPGTYTCSVGGSSYTDTTLANVTVIPTGGSEERDAEQSATAQRIARLEAELAKLREEL